MRGWLDMLKIGILGAGFMGDTHCICYNALRDCDIEITAIADPDTGKAARLAESFGARVYRTSDELIENENVDIIDICLPTFLHKEYILKSIGKGRHILCEKPIALNMAEAEEILRAAEGYGKNIMTAHCIRFWPEYMLFSDYVRNGDLGRFLSAAFFRISPRRKPGTAWEDWIVDSARSGGAVIDLQVHDADFLRSVFGEPDMFQSALYYNHGHPEHIYTHYKFGSAIVSTEAGWDYPSGIFPFSMSYRAVFEKGTLVYDSAAPEKKVKIYMENGEVVTPCVQYPEIAPVGTSGNMPAVYGYYNEIQYFLDCVRNNRPTDKCSLAESAKSLELVYGVAENSVKAGRP